MAIDPIKAGHAPQTDAARLGQTGANQAARSAAQVRSGEAGKAAAPPQGTPRDSVELSDASRAAVDQARAAGESPSGLSSDRLRGILDRLKSGYYDSAEVRDRIAGRVEQELGDVGGGSGV